MCDCTDHKDEIPAYDAQAIESKWMKAWEDSNLFAVDTDESKPKKYVLEMFPYPSGDLHMGHARNYTIGDAMARQARMRGFDVLHPIGFDAFGLPAENAAIKHNTQAAAWTYKNMDQALATMKRMGFSYDLDRMVKTCSPDYYRWGQWIFEKLWEKGLVYRKKNPVNWCPNCKTVLANEQVTEGKCWRCGTEPEKRDLEQWYFKITEYSQELLDDLEKLPGWPERVKQMQANWIGRSEGAEVDFTLCDQDGEPIEGDEGKITVFTTRADTLFGVSFFVLAPEYAGLHELVEGTEYEEAVTKIVEDSKHISAVERAQGTLEKHGAFTGRYVVNPVNGEKVPVWVADYVVADYGTGAVMAVPCGDQRDFEFARKYDLPIVPIILDDDDRAAVEASGETIDTFHAETVDWDCAHAAEGTLVQSGKYTARIYRLRRAACLCHILTRRNKITARHRHIGSVQICRSIIRIETNHGFEHLIILVTACRIALRHTIKFIQTQLTRGSTPNATRLFYISISTDYIFHRIVRVTKTGIDLTKQKLIVPGITRLDFLFTCIRITTAVHQLQNAITIRKCTSFQITLQSCPVLRLVVCSHDTRREIIQTLYIILQCFRTSLGKAGVIGITTLRRSIALNVNRSDAGISIIAHGVSRGSDLSKFYRITTVILVNFRAVHWKINISGTFQFTGFQLLCFRNTINKDRRENLRVKIQRSQRRTVGQKYLAQTTTHLIAKLKSSVGHPFSKWHHGAIMNFPFKTGTKQ